MKKMSKKDIEIIETITICKIVCPYCGDESIIESWMLEDRNSIGCQNCLERAMLVD